MKATFSPENKREIFLDSGRRSLPELDFNRIKDSKKNDSDSQQENDVNLINPYELM
jgi:hypothetical protein